MANEEQLKILKQGVNAWNKWREENLETRPDLTEADLSWARLREANLFMANLSGAELRGTKLSGANLRGAKLREADLSWVNLSEANLRRAGLWRADLTEANLSGTDLRGAKLDWAKLFKADLSEADLKRTGLRQTSLVGANLRGAKLREADLSGADLSGADLRGAKLFKADLRLANFTEANLTEANLTEANLSWANLSGAKLRQAQLVQTNLREADLTGCSIFGISAWGLELSGATQTDLVITPSHEPAITVDNLEVAQFIYLLLNNEKVRSVIDTITTKVVLILGRFTPKRKAVLDAIRDELRNRNYLPVMFDFEKPASRDLTETVRTLAHLARFIIADITEPRSIPQELQAIIPDLAVPVQPLLLEGSTGEYGMFQDLTKYDWVLDVHRYDSLEGLLASLGDKVITPAEAKAKEWEKRRLLGG
jgi:uncharacterized protein YjbI with pentapeptide repeats